MKTVGAFEAKTHFNQLLARAAAGESIRITRRGIPVAALVPAGDDGPTDLKAVVEEIRKVRQGARLRGLTIRELIDEGRRY